MPGMSSSGEKKRKRPVPHSASTSSTPHRPGFPSTSVVQTPHTLRLLRLAVSGATEHSATAQRLLSDLASRSTPEVLWDLLGRLVAESSNIAVATGLYSNKWSERANAAATIGAVAKKLPIADRMGFLGDESHINSKRASGESGVFEGERKIKNEDEVGLWLRVEDLLSSSGDCDGDSNVYDNDAKVRSDSSTSSVNKDHEEEGKRGESKLDFILDKGRLLLSSSRETYNVCALDNASEEHSALRSLDESASKQASSGKSNFVNRRVKLQRRILARRLGLGGILSAPIVSSSSSHGPDFVGSLVDDEDLIAPSASANIDAVPVRRNYLERRGKNKYQSISTVKEGGGNKQIGDNGDEGGITLRDLLVLEVRRSTEDSASSSGRRTSSNHALSHRNPQLLLATDLLYKTFDEDWTVRHGALLGILALVRSWMVGIDNLYSSFSFGRWPNDILVRCLCILGLDRFGDYSGASLEGKGAGGDHVVAPVRESAAQLLSVLLTLAPESVQIRTYRILCHLARHPDFWEIRHGAMLAIKYVAAIRNQGSIQGKSGINLNRISVSCGCWEGITKLSASGLSDQSDDVRGTSAETLSCFFQLPSRILTQKSTFLNEIVISCSGHLWSALLQAGAVSSCAVDILTLFAHVISYDCDLALRSVGPTSQGTVFKVRCFAQPSGPLGALNLGDIFEKLIEFSKLQGSAVKLTSLRALGIVSRPLIVSAPESSFTAVTKQYCELLSSLFSFFLEDSDDISIRDTTSDGSVVWLEARNHSWYNIVAIAPLIIGDDQGTKTETLALQQRRLVFFKMLMHLILRFFGIECKGAATSRFDRFFKAVDEGSYSWFSCQRIAARALAELLLFSGFVQEENRKRIQDLFLPSILQCLLSSPWAPFCESACILFEAVAKAIETEERKKDSLIQCRTIFTSLLVQSPPCVLLAARGDSSKLLVDQDVINACDSSFVSMLDSFTEALACEPDKNFKPVSPDRVIGLWRGVFLSKGVDISVKPSFGDSSKCITTNSMRLTASLAGAAISFGIEDLPIKLTPLIRPLMTSIKNESAHLERLDSTCLHLSVLVKALSKSHVYVRDKVLANLCDLALSSSVSSAASASKQVLRLIVCEFENHGIDRIQPIHTILNPLVGEFEVLPDILDVKKALELLLVLTVEMQASSTMFQQIITDLLPCIPLIACSSPQEIERKKAMTITTILCRKDPKKALPKILVVIMKQMTAFGNHKHRKFVCLLLQYVIDSSETEICPFVRYILPVVMPLMTDTVHEVAKVAAGVFSSLVRVSPLVPKGIASTKDPSCFPEFNIFIDSKSEKVIDHLIHGEPLPTLSLPSSIQACLDRSGVILRPYQHEGIAWMHFLQSVHLSGALCDDMGLGKTLQALIGIAVAHTELSDDNPLKLAPSLIVCPSTIVGHWMNEIQRFFPDALFYHPLSYTGPLRKRRALMRNQLNRCNIVVTSYSVLRNDISELSGISWVYCVLDEGHLLKNPNSATAKASRQIRSCYKMILTGTPVQNNVNELWASFDFLMPNYLGTVASFTRTFAKPIINGQLSNATLEDISIGLNKLKLLHQTVLPFILRREKLSVMKELPPKVISDIPCTLSTEQKALYTRFVTSSDAKRSLSCFQDHINLLRQGIEDSKGKKVGKDVFRALLYLRLLCTHPTLVLERERGGEDNAIVGAIDPADEALSRLDCSGKLLALNDLLRSSRICSDSLVGADNDQSTLYTTRSTFNLDSGSAEEEFDSLLLDSNADFDASESIDVSQGQESKCLIFAQFTRSLDAIEDYLFTPHMPSLRYLRIDGNVSPEDRSKRVDEFNTDDSIKVMLLTTRVGGLGLNLTGNLFRST